MKASTINLTSLGERMKAAREGLGLSQKDFHAKFGNGGFGSYQKNEAGYNEAGIGLAASFVRAGINANWLLTGEGQMLLSAERPEPPPAVQINEKALAILINTTEQMKRSASTQARASMVARMYMEFSNAGFITPDSISILDEMVEQKHVA
jgi:transcriptional regulator with XRE-family HTH domain